MKGYIIVAFLFLTACTATEVPVTESIATALLTTPPPTINPTSTTEPIPPTATQMTTQETINQRVSSMDGMPQVYIPAGTFRMGGLDVRRAPNEIPEHDVTLDAFWMDQLEVTNAMYMLCVNSGGCEPPQELKSQRRREYFGNPEFNDYPVVYVTWAQAKAYCEWAERRLPTEAEWERAGRGDDFRTFPWGEDKADGLLANFNMLVGDTSRVGTYPAGASPFGVLDMSGNVAEWVNDFYSFDYSALLENTLNPTGLTTSSGLNRVVRGGSLGDASPRIGFRCAE